MNSNCTATFEFHCNGFKGVIILQYLLTPYQFITLHRRFIIFCLIMTGRFIFLWFITTLLREVIIFAKGNIHHSKGIRNRTLAWNVLIHTINLPFFKIYVKIMCQYMSKYMLEECSFFHFLIARKTNIRNQQLKFFSCTSFNNQFDLKVFCNEVNFNICVNRRLL